MTEAYAFLAAFAVQIFVVSVLHAAWFTRYVRAKAEAQFPGWDGKTRERFLGFYGAVNTAIAVLGLGLLAWLFQHMKSPDWSVAPVLRLLGGYNIVQTAPFILASFIGAWIKRKSLLQTPPPAKRTASLQRRGLFDIVSPFIVFIAVAGYVFFAAFMIHIQHQPGAEFPAYSLLRTITLVFIMNAFVVYWLLYRRKKWSLETPAYRMQAVEVQVKIMVYLSIVVTAFMALVTTLRLLHLLRWVPFATSVYFIICMLFTSMMLFALRRQAEADRLGPIPA